MCGGWGECVWCGGRGECVVCVVFGEVCVVCGVVGGLLCVYWDNVKTACKADVFLYCIHVYV